MKTAAPGRAAAPTLPPNCFGAASVPEVSHSKSSQTKIKLRYGKIVKKKIRKIIDAQIDSLKFNVRKQRPKGRRGKTLSTPRGEQKDFKGRRDRVFPLRRRLGTMCSACFFKQNVPPRPTIDESRAHSSNRSPLWSATVFWDTILRLRS